MQFDDSGGGYKPEAAVRVSRTPSGTTTFKRLIKLVVIGSVSVGKTSLLDQFVNNRFRDQYKATIGLDFLTTEMMIGDKLVTLQIWDTAGQERYSSLGRAFYHGAEGALLVFDKNNAASFKRLKAWKQEFLVSCNPPDPDTFPIVVVGNKCDISKPKVPRAVAAAWCQEQGNPYVEVSARANINVQEAFLQVVRLALLRKPPADASCVLYSLVRDSCVASCAALRGFSDVPDTLDLTDAHEDDDDETGCCR